MIVAPLPNLHATAVVVGDRGILIRGASGSGKTTLALALIAAARTAGRHAALLADDQVLLSAREGRLICLAPPSITGLVEVRGITPQRLVHEGSAVIDLVVTLVEESDAPRYSEPVWCEMGGCRLPELVLASRGVNSTLPALASVLLLPPFDRNPVNKAASAAKWHTALHFWACQ
ncbi:HPr kinase/phosphorylase [Mesorhizobium sp. ASY16-5R]|uniref:HPr kinase/phosphorylase n=1 Tax=Mesorhizobium sp. ASY16-5R TaxID=3445772 RepID=UPI003FA04E77